MEIFGFEYPCLNILMFFYRWVRVRVFLCSGKTKGDCLVSEASKEIRFLL